MLKLLISAGILLVLALPLVPCGPLQTTSPQEYKEDIAKGWGSSEADYSSQAWTLPASAAAQVHRRRDPRGV